MKIILSEQDSDNKPFKITYLVAMSLMAKWKEKNGPKEKLLDLQEKDPNQANDIIRIIKEVEASHVILLQAANRFKQASAAAYKEYDEDLGVVGKVQKFFGFDNEKKMKTTKFKLEKQEGRFQFSMQAGGPNSEEYKYTIKDVTSPGFDISLFLDNPDDAKQLIKKAVQYRQILSPDFKKNKNVVDDEDVLPTAEKFQDQLEALKNQEPDELIKKLIFEDYKELLNGYSNALKNLETENRATKDNKIKYAQAYREHEIVSLWYEFGKSDEIENDEIMKSFKEKSLVLDNDKIVSLLKTIAQNFLKNPKEFTDSEDATFSDLKNNYEKFDQIVRDRDYEKLKSLFASDQEKEKEKLVSPKALTNFLNFWNSNNLKKLQNSPALFVFSENGTGLYSEKTLKIDDIYLMGNDFFKNLSEDKETMKIIKLLLNSNTNNIRNLKKQTQGNIEKAYDFLKKIEEEKIKEQKSDLERLYKYMVQNEEQLKKDLNINDDTFKRNKIAIEKEVNSDSSNNTESFYKFYYNYLKQKKPELLKIFKQITDQSETEKPEKINSDEQKVEKLDFKDDEGREFFIVNTNKYGKILYYISSGQNTSNISAKDTPVPMIGITFYNYKTPIWYFKFSATTNTGPEGITFEKNPQDDNVSPQDKDFKSFRGEVEKVMENEKKTVNNLKELENSIKEAYSEYDQGVINNVIKNIVFAIKFNRFLENKGALRKDFARGATFPFWGIDDISIKNFVISKDVSILDVADRATELNKFINKLKNLNSLDEIAEEYIKLFKKLGGDRNNLFSKKKYIEAMKQKNYRTFSKLGFKPKLRELIGDRADEIINSQKNTQEQLIKLIKPLLREKLKRKINGKKNLRN